MPVLNIAADELVFTQIPERSNFRNLTGLVFGRLTVLGYAGVCNKITCWYSRCTCGNITKVSNKHLIYNRVLSCGCLKKEAVAERRTKHGHSKGRRKTPELRTYISMLERCNNPNNKDYKNYGGRGIKVLLTFEEFINEVGLKPSKEHTIDRIDNDGNYEKGNVRWATRLEQSKNKRSNVLIKYKDDKKTFSEWAELLNTNIGTLRSRIYGSKMCIHHAFTLPHGSRKPKDCPDCNL